VLGDGDVFGGDDESEAIDESGSATALTDAAAGTTSKLPDRLPEIRGSEGDSVLANGGAGNDAWRVGPEDRSSSSPKSESGGTAGG
jgi:hypothetical protein